MSKYAAAIIATRDYAKEFTPKVQPAKKDTSRTIILESLDFSWKKQDIQTFREMWQDGVGIAGIASKLRRDPDEVVLLVMHEAREGTSEPRRGGVYGAGTDDAGED
jgi:hypothetical protein